MRTTWFILLLCFIGLVKEITSETITESIEINKYLRAQLIRATHSLAQSFEQKTRIKKNVPQSDVLFDAPVRLGVGFGMFSSNIIFSQHNSSDVIYAIDESNIFQLSKDNELRSIIRIEDDKVPMLIEVVSWDVTIDLFIVNFQDDIIRVYQSTISDKPVQTIRLRISAAKCFDHQGIYCIFVAETASGESVAKLFKWVGTHFDIQQKLKVPPASSIIAFASGADVVILLAPKKTQGKVSILLRWTGSTLVKVQNLKLQTSCNQCLQYFEYEAKHYVVTDESVLLWNGHRLVYKSKIQFREDLANPLLINIGDFVSSPLIFILYKHHILVYNPRRDFQLDISYYVPDQIISASLTSTQMNGSVLYVTKDKNTLLLNAIPFTVEPNDQEILSSQADPLMQCLSSLQNVLLINKGSIDVLEKQGPTVLRTDIPQTYPGILKAGVTARVRSGSVSNGSPKDYNHVTSPSELLVSVVELEAKTSKLNSMRERLFYKSRPNVIRSSLHVAGGVSSVEGNLDSASISAATGADGSIFLDRPTAPDSIESVLVAQSINAHHLKTAPGTIIDDLLLNGAKQEITGRYSGNTLVVKNILHSAGKINDVPIKNLVRYGNQEQISGTKTIQTLFAHNVDTATFNKINTMDWINSMNTAFEDRSAIYENISIRNLQVEYLNGVKWNDFVSSLYFDTKDHSYINGDVIFNSRSRIHSAHFEKMFGIPFDHMLTKTTDQIISSNITISNLHVQSVAAKAINGLDFKNSVATAGEDVIKNAEIFHLNVANDLTLNDNSLLDKQISGTRLDELLQMYNGKVIVKGTVTIPNLYLESHVKVQVKDVDISLNISEHYWTKSSDQNVQVDVKINQPLHAPQVYLDKLNMIDWTQYMTINGASTHPSNLVFEKAYVTGNLAFDRNNQFYNPYLQSLNAKAVRLSGKYVIHGDIVFTGPVYIKAGDIQLINDVLLTDLVSTTEALDIEFKGTKRLSSLNVSSITTTDANIEILNGIDVKGYLRDLPVIDEPAMLSTLNINSVTAEYLNVESLNILGMRPQIPNKQYRSHEGRKNTIRITGDVHFEEINGLHEINDIKLAEYLSLVVLSNRNVQVGGHKIFQAPITINEDFAVSVVSNVDLDYLYKYGLLNSIQQNITGRYTIQDLKTDTLITKSINALNMGQLIDTSVPAFINSNIWFKAPLTVNDLEWTKYCNTPAMDSALYEMPDRTWNSVHITENLEHSALTRTLENLVEYAVTDSSSKSVSGKVRFDGVTYFGNITAVNYINDVNTNAIANDALLKTSEAVQISSHKTFVSSVSLATTEIRGDFETSVINGINIKELNESLVWKSGDNVITGNKMLVQSVYVDQLQVDGSINGVAMDNVVFYDDERAFPKTVFNTLHISEDLHVRNLNGRDFEEFLNKRIRLRGAPQNVTAHVQFPQLDIGPSYIAKINDISLDEIVFTDMPEPGPISGLKIFDKGLIVEGDMSVQYLNNYHLTSTYENSVSKNKDYFIPRVTFNSAVYLSNGLYVHSFENQSWLEFYAQAIPDNPYVETIEYKINYTFSNIKPYYHYLYLEPSEIHIPKPTSKRVDTIRPGLLHLWDTASGEACGLPSFCSCPLQYTADVSNQRTVTILPGNTTHRLLSIYDHDIGLNIFTNSISTSSSCSSPYEEYTYISWLQPLRLEPHGYPTGEITVDGQRFTGYLTDARFFRSNDNRMFVVLAVYYDKAKDSHDVDSLLIELHCEQHNTEIVQYIPTRSAIALELLRSSHGTHLVICNSPQDENVQAYVEIMKFGTNGAEFELARSFSTEGCGLLASAVLHKEQFIFVGDPNHKILRITRYVDQLDMFHYFQSFIYDSYLRGIHIFYPEGLSMDEAFLCAITDDGNFYIYVYTYIEGWKQISTGYLKNAQDVTSFRVNTEEYLFMSSTYQNVVFKIVRQGIP